MERISRADRSKVIAEIEEDGGMEGIISVLVLAYHLQGSPGGNLKLAPP
jgi:hypothetical protein